MLVYRYLTDHANTGERRWSHRSLAADAVARRTRAPLRSHAPPGSRAIVLTLRVGDD